MDPLPPPSSFQAVGWIIVCLAAVGAAFMGIRNFLRSGAGLPDTPQARTLDGQPIRVTPEPRYVPESDFRRHVEDVDQRFRELDRRIMAIHDDISNMRREFHTSELNLIRSGEERAAKLHERINLILERVSELRGRSDATPT